MKTKSLQHLNPIWRDKANFIIGMKCPYEMNGDDDIWEQLWSRRISDFQFEICCIPFFVYDLSLGDEVITNEKFMIDKVIKPSGHYTYRVWFGDSVESDARKLLLDELTKTSSTFEWYSDNLIAIDTLAENAQFVANFLFEKEKAGLLKYETGKMTG